MNARFVDEFLRAVNATEESPARAGLVAARIAYPKLDPAAWLAELDVYGDAARQHLELGVGGDPPARTRLRVVSDFFFGQLGFVGNREQYEDPRNSFLNDVIARRTGIPITMAVVFIEIARRAGLAVDGVNFPGHFLMRCSAELTQHGGGAAHSGGDPALIVDPFNGGAVLSDADCLRLLRTHAGADARLEPGLLQPASKQTILLRMLLNLKRAFVRVRSFDYARDVSELLVALDPSALTELRDRGLLASHLRDYAAALRDLEAWLAATAGQGDDVAEVREVWDHVKALRRRLASLN